MTINNMKNITAILLILISCISKGQVKNIDQDIRQKLLENYRSRFPKVDIDLLSFNYEVTSSPDFSIDEKQIVRLPNKYDEEVYKNVNCSSERKGWIEQFSINTTNGNNITISEGVITSKTTQINASLNFGKFTIGGSINQSIQISNNFQSSYNNTTSETRSRGIDTNVKPKTSLYVKLINTTALLRAPFILKLTVDGDFVMRRIPIFTSKGSGIFIHRIQDAIKQRDTKEDHLKLSDVLSIEERTFYIKGFIDNSKSTDLVVKYGEKTLNAQDCQISEPTSGVSYKSFAALVTNMEADKKLTKKDKSTIEKIDKGELFFTKSSKLNSNQYDSILFNLVIEEYSGSITINTDNVYGGIDVQHMSFGPGFCNVVTRSTSSSVGINAPPYIWSGWQNLKYHMGEITTTITNQVNCDTGVRSQVRYYKKN